MVAEGWYRKQLPVGLGFLLGDENALKLDYVDGSKLWTHPKNIKLYLLNWSMLFFIRHIFLIDPFFKKL